MEGVFNKYFEQTFHGLTFIVLGLVIFYLAKWVKDILTPYDLNEEYATKDNTAAAISLSGYYFGIMIIFFSIISSPGRGFITDIIMISIFSVVGIVFLNLSDYLGDKLILNQFSVDYEVYEDKNIGAGAAAFGNYIASSIFIAVAMSGDLTKSVFNGYFSDLLGQEGGMLLEAMLITLLYFVTGQIAIIIFSKFYFKISPYDLQMELKEKNNAAAGVSFAGALIAIGIIVGRALKQEFRDFIETGMLVFFEFALSLILIPAIRLFADKVILPHVSIKKEIAEEQNMAAGIIEACIMISFAGVIFYAL